MKAAENKGQFDPVRSDECLRIASLLKGCLKVKDLPKGFKLHAYIQEHEFLQKNTYVSNNLVSMYARCGAPAKAQQVLNRFPVRNAIMWTALVSGYVQCGQGQLALECFNNMQHDGHSPDVVTFICALRACGSIRAIAMGVKIHDQIVSMGMLEKSVLLQSTLVDMYARCGALAKAKHVLEELPARDVVAWTALIAGYAQHGQGQEALECFDSMLREGHSPDAVTFICALKACRSIGATVKGEKIHDKISTGMLKKNVLLGSTLVDMYARCGATSKAHQVLGELPVRNAVTWTALISGYTQEGQGEEALKCFDSMQEEGHDPDMVTFTCALKACGIVGAVAKGIQNHEKIVSLGILEEDFVLGTALVDMYAKCAELGKALKLLKELHVQDVFTWNAIIGGYAQQGQSREALLCVKRMQYKGVKPDSTTLICVLNACSHAGQLDQADTCFSEMSIEYGITPDLEHYCCMVDLFSRAGKFNKALGVIEKMPSSLEYLPLWFALMGASRIWGEVNIGGFAFEHALSLDKNSDAIYVSMANIYTAAGIQEDADKIEVVRVDNEVGKVPGCC